MNKNDTKKDRVKTTDTALDIIETIEELEGPTLSDITDKHDIAKSTAHRHLQTLLHREYIVKEGSTYHLSLKFMRLGEHSRHRRPEYPLIKSTVDDIARETQEQAQFFIEEHNRGRYVYFQRGERAVRTGSLVGRAAPLHTGSSGKAILAFLPDERIQEIIDDVGLEPMTEHTITDEYELWQEIEEIRERGYAFNDSEYIEGVRGVGAPVMHPGGNVLGGLSVSGAANRLSGTRFREELPNLLLGLVNELEVNIAHS
jgi:DNA-binding IclR family transcriptional regulator